MARLASEGKPVSLRVELRARYLEEDRNSYAPVLNQFPQELNIGQVIKFDNYCTFLCNMTPF